MRALLLSTVFALSATAALAADVTVTEIQDSTTCRWAR